MTVKRRPNPVVQIALNDAARKVLSILPIVYSKSSVVRAALDLLFEHRAIIIPAIQKIDPNQAMATAKLGSKGVRFAFSLHPEKSDLMRTIALENLMVAVEDNGFAIGSHMNSGVALMFCQLFELINRSEKLTEWVLKRAKDPAYRHYRGVARYATVAKREARSAEQLAEYMEHRHRKMAHARAGRIGGAQVDPTPNHNTAEPEPAIQPRGLLDHMDEETRRAIRDAALEQEESYD